METNKVPIIDLESLKSKIKEKGLIPVQAKAIESYNRIVLKEGLEGFLELVKAYGQKYVYFSYEFYNKKDYLIPLEDYRERSGDYKKRITEHNSKLEEFNFNNPKDLEIYIIKDGFLVGIKETDHYLKENNIPTADERLHELEYIFQFEETTDKQGHEEELREIIFKDPEFKYCKNQEARYWYLIELLEQDGMEKYRYLAEPPGVYFNGKIKMFMDKTWQLYKEQQ